MIRMLVLELAGAVQYRTHGITWRAPVAVWPPRRLFAVVFLARVLVPDFHGRRRLA